MSVNVASCTARHITFGLLVLLKWRPFSQGPIKVVSATIAVVSFSLFWLKANVSYKRRRQIIGPFTFFWMFLAPRFLCLSRRSFCDRREHTSRMRPRKQKLQRREAQKDQAKKVVWGYMVKWISAYGGCLGGSRRWRTWKSAICLGELINELWSGDFRMGKPTLLAGYR